MSEENKVNKFDICLMNLPYYKNLHLKFLEKTIEIAEKVVSIQPDMWITNKYGFSQKDKVKNKMRDNLAKYIEEIEQFSKDETNSFFNTNSFLSCSIFVLDRNADGIDISKFNSGDDLTNKIVKRIMDFSSIRSHFSKRIDDEKFVPVRQTNHGYLNWVEKDINKIKSKKGIMFDSVEEANNFIDSFNTWLYQYLNCTDWDGSENSAQIPFLDDYSKPWTNEQLFKLFNITSEEEKTILDTIKENPWKS